jgi:hypothetical protein
VTVCMGLSGEAGVSIHGIKRAERLILLRLCKFLKSNVLEKNVKV